MYFASGFSVFFLLIGLLSSSEFFQEHEKNETVLAVEGGKVDLECDTTPPSKEDQVALVLWYKDESTTPLYSLDSRRRGLHQAKHAKSQEIEGRAFLDVSTHPTVLKIEKLRAEDEGEYRCRVDFKLARSRNSLVKLEIISNAMSRIRRNANDSDALGKIKNLIQQARTDTGDVDFNGLLSENIYDPVPLQAFNISSDGFITKLFGQFTDLNLYGLKGFRVDRIAMNLAKMNLSADMSVPILSIVGQYYLDGTVTFFSLVGDGPFWMNMSSIKLTGNSLIGSTREGRLSMGDIHLESDVGDIALHFENLMGGGAWGSISNSLLNQLSELILGELKPSLLREMSSYLKHQFNNELFQQLPEGFMNPNSSNLVDSLLDKASTYMVEHEIEPLLLQEYEEIYESNLLFVTTRGKFKLYNGTLHGLSTIARKGDVITVFANNSLIFEADFGFDNLTGGYSWTAELFGSGATGIMEVQVKDVEGFIRIKQAMKAGSKLELDTLYVKDIRHVWLDLQGLGRWDYVMESVINLVTNGLKLQLADAIAEPVKSGIQEQLHLFSMNFR